jgi:tetratricopeptide (TPR) repeat protein
MYPEDEGQILAFRRHIPSNKGQVMKLGITAVVLVIALAGCTTTPTNANRLAMDGYEYIKQGKMDKAEQALNAALEDDPKNPFALLNLGVVYQETGRREEALRKWLQVVDLDSSETAARSTVSAERGEKLKNIARRNLDLFR